MLPRSTRLHIRPISAHTIAASKTGRSEKSGQDEGPIGCMVLAFDECPFEQHKTWNAVRAGGGSTLTQTLFISPFQRDEESKPVATLRR